MRQKVSFVRFVSKIVQNVQYVISQSVIIVLYIQMIFTVIIIVVLIIVLIFSIQEWICMFAEFEYKMHKYK